MVTSLPLSFMVFDKNADDVIVIPRHVTTLIVNNRVPAQNIQLTTCVPESALAPSANEQRVNRKRKLEDEHSPSGERY
jgi:hypothetical protein